ncbi:RluA family pseudouridine synthase [Geobacter sp. SVR]|uniref:RluA family pseudouridine synthase n=1 Tax=Geobacter sp. SVR TaxID=2495594 RepID=UPI00143EFEDD|nr:RluA family pseudouridine synthase [Geobacter sp. SVR]BCS55587.1 RNA pseudouridine synthase [Geobacter sp. SVR]GCF83590.1 RNA pseudouridine synthase [Geobacter sp. SVR]
MIRRETVNEATGGRRLDDVIPALFVGLSKSEARRIIDRGGCAVNNSMVRVASRTVVVGDVIEVGVMEPGRFRELVLPQEALLYEDRDLVALNKPAGVNTQRTPYQLKGTLEYWVAEYFRQQGSKEPARIIHRLDRGTSGVMVFPKHRQAAAWLSKRFHDGQVEKLYLALVSGQPQQEVWRVDGAIGKIGSARYGIMSQGRSAVTEFRLVGASGGHSLVNARPLTGRTHQIRVHLASCGLPIVGDKTYEGEPGERMMLHCAALAFRNEKGTEIRLTALPDGLFAAMMKEYGLDYRLP